MRTVVFCKSRRESSRESRRVRREVRVVERREVRWADSCEREREA
jgi:hypothetical protein